MNLYLDSHTAVSIQLGSPGLHVAFGLTLGLLLLTLPLMTRVCVTVRAVSASELRKSFGGRTTLDAGGLAITSHPACE